MSILNPYEALRILRNKKRLLVRDGKFPYTIFRLDLYKEFGKENIEPALIRMVENKQIKMHHTMHDVGFDIPIAGRYRRIEDDLLKRCKFKTL